MGWLVLAAAILGFAAAAGIFVFTLRRVGANLLGNGSFEDTAGTFMGGVTSLMPLTNGSRAIPDWEVIGTIKWSRERNSSVGPKDGDFFLDLVGRSGTGPAGGVGQGLLLDADSDYELSVHVGTSPPRFPGPATIRIRIEDTALVTRFQWERTSNPAGSGMTWEKLTFRFNTRGWVVKPTQSGAFFIEAPRELNPGRELVGVDLASLFLLESTFSRWFR